MSKMHPRYFEVAQAEGEIHMAILEVAKKRSLTFGEIVTILSRSLSSFAKYEIREERHPDNPEKPGDCA